jgi:formylmethanofuran dehydrogenase subunit B
MSESITPAIAWTCPFCSLLCDGFGLADARNLELQGSDCPRARAALAAHRHDGVLPGPRLEGAPVSLDEALDAAAERLARWRQPLFGGLGTDIAGARALYRLAERTGAICDPADGAALMHGLRALQDRGQMQTTLAEIRCRADLLVCIGTPAIERFPEFFNRCGIGEADSPCKAIVFLGVAAPQLPVGAPASVQVIPGTSDLFADLQQLGALVRDRRVRDADAGLTTLARQLREARYAVLVWESGQLPGQGALLVEALQRIVATLNDTTRAATFPLGGSDGAAAVNQVFAWLTGLPLRSRVGPLGLEHEPLRFAADRLLADQAVDGLLWISSFDAARLPPAVELPRIVLGPPAMAARLEPSDIFLPVGTPGLDAAGHLLRTDGIVIVPLSQVRDAGLPGVDALLGQLEDRLGPRPQAARARVASSSATPS